jgi:hypothetical protein
VRGELGQLRRDPVELVRGVDVREDVGERGEQARIGIAARKVAHAGRQLGGARDAHRRKRRDRRPAPAGGDDEAALLQRPVGRGDGRRADLEGRGQLAHRRQPRRRGQAAVRDLALDGRSDGCRARAEPDKLY